MIYVDVFRNSIELTNERWIHITKEHPEITDYKERISKVLADPDYVKKSHRDEAVWLYYKFYDDIFNGKYMIIVAKKGARSFILTGYFTDIIKKGVTIWARK